jgi:translocation and assembly module TamA
VVNGCATPSEPKRGRPVLTSVDFVGNDHVSAKDLRERIATEATSGWFSKTVRYYDPDLFEIDKQRIERTYNAKGFFHAQVEGVDVVKDSEGRVSLRVHVKEGQRAIISNFSIEGLDKLEPKQRLRVEAASGLQPGDGFDEDAYERAKARTVTELKERGYAEAKVTGRVEIEEQYDRAKVVLKANTGPKFTFGRVIVSGNRDIPADAIIRATGIKKGDVYKPSKLELAQQRVYQLGTFSGVRVGLEPIPGGSAVAPVRVNVREAPFQTVRAGVGFQLETDRNVLPRLRAEYTNRNLFGDLRRLELAANGGYAFTPSIISPQKSGIVLATYAQLTNPHILLPGLELVSRLEYTKELQISFDYQSLAARLSLVYRYGRHTITPSLNFVRYFDVNVPASALQQGLTVGGTVVAAPSLLRDSCEAACLLVYPELRYTFDQRDNVLEPTRGFFISVDFQQALKPGNFTYFRFEPELRGYLSLGKLAVLAGRVDYGVILPEGGTKSPGTVRFFAGGANSNRGYGPNAQGPKFGANPRGYANTGVPNDNVGGTFTQAVPAGGNGLMLLSGEFRIRIDPVLQNLVGVVFLDASRVTTDAQLPWTTALEYAPGIGLRYLTPFGPIRLDVAYLVNPADQVAANQNNAILGPIITQPTPVSAGCPSSATNCIRQGRIGYHLTLGEAF